MNLTTWTTKFEDKGSFKLCYRLDGYDWQQVGGVFEVGGVFAKLLLQIGACYFAQFPRLGEPSLPGSIGSDGGKPNWSPFCLYFTDDRPIPPVRDPAYIPDAIATNPGMCCISGLCLNALQVASEAE